jgi:hypothetical protein
MTFNRKTVSVTASADSPAVSTADMKAYLRVSGSGDDDLIASFVTSATEAMKQYLRIGLLTETYKFQMDRFADVNPDLALMSLGGGVHDLPRAYVLGNPDRVDLPFAPLQSITSIVTYDRDNDSSTFSSDNYEVDLQGGRVYLNEGETWPAELRATNAVEITYVAGYGSGSIPAPIVQAIKMYVSTLYDGTCEGVTDQMSRLVSPYRRHDELPFS